MTIYKKINEVMKKVTYVQKDKAVTGMGAGYKAVTHDQLVSVLRSAMVDVGLMVVVSQTRGHFNEPGQRWDKDAQQLVPSNMRLYEGEYDVSVVDCETGDKITVHVEAHAQDNGDKAPGKAMTYATKTAMLKLFWLETGENDESREEVREKNKPKPPSLTEKRFADGLTAIRKGDYTAAAMRESFSLTDPQEKLLAALETELAEAK